MKFAQKTKTCDDLQNKAWKIVIVDDEKEVHSVTKFALEGFKFENRGVEFISAYSFLEAKKILLEHEDIAVLMLDVVLQSKESGLELVKYIREELDNKQMRIILRTGQPGVAPKEDVIEKYDINDYKEKTELTDKRLYISTITALRSYRDIKRVEKETKRANEAELLMLQQSKMASMGELIGVIAHQLYQPLTSMQLVATMIKDEVQEEASAESIVDLSDKILDQARFMSMTIKGFREFLRPSKKKTEFEVISSFVYVNDLLRPVMNENFVSIQLNFVDCTPQDGVLVYGYESELKHVFLNILTNAKDAMVERNVNEKEIEVRFLKDSKSITVEIEDSGGGVQEEILDKIFESGFSTKDQKGSGIGLYLAKRIINENLGGDISVKNTDKGACFCIELPIFRL
ncbi:MAG: sensor histidine kinase [Campylobacterales bacterium]